MRGFVSAAGTRLVDSFGVQFSVNGANCYYLGQRSQFMADEVFQATLRYGFNTLRIWAFQDEDQPVGGFAALDYAVSRARALGLKLILTLINNWQDFGGMDRVCAACDLTEHDEFYRDPNARALYREWAEKVVTRYRNEPALMLWELANEPRGDPAAIRAWVDEMSRHVRALDPNHLIAAGEEGFESYLDLPCIDVGTFHLYPEKYFGDVDAQPRWIRDHLREGARAGKPVLLTEYGVLDLNQRQRKYDQWRNEIAERGGAGELVWMLAGVDDAGEPYYNDGFTFY